MRSKMGWSLPPGVSQRQIDEAAGVDDEPCECCGLDVEDCICDTCPRCGGTGDPDCYTGKCTTHEPCPKCFEGECTHAPGMNCPPRRLNYTRDQRMGQARVRITGLKQQIDDEMQYLAWLEDKPAEWRDE